MRNHDLLTCVVLEEKPFDKVVLIPDPALDPASRA
jgi:hypothetical protein